MRWVRKSSSGRAISICPAGFHQGVAIGMAIMGHAMPPGPLGLNESARRHADARPVILMREDVDDGPRQIVFVIGLEQGPGRLVPNELTMSADIRSRHHSPAR